ncbi:hypothetical protein NQ314_004738 [Rhamnusium bicolor]|uniref:CUB domain-containing protein n=1 Tax=Rhamnusium bicolor TaxID=1586634 RepID=A0AAV8ZJ50_9CUCU|nr:hypothetical protein NQ314_004738 [Rhamnusium bicolor]
MLFQTTTEDFTEEVTHPIIQSRNIPNLVQAETECCSNDYRAKRFVLTSPNFPYTLNHKTECIYKIHKANDNVCRLRLNFLLFWLGYTNFNNYCPYGFLEIDGKYICGCNKELKLTTTFGDSDVKILKFKTDGFFQNYNTGFVLEIIQDECPKKYSPENFEKFTRNYSNEFRYYRDQINRVAWPSDMQQNFIQKLQLINERTEILDDEDDIYFQSKPTIVKSVYFFAAPEYNDIPSLFIDKEKTTYIDTNSVDPILTNPNYDECLNWNQKNFNDLNTRYGQTLQQTCKRKDDSEASTADESGCVELSNINGDFRSPGYPCYYPENLNLCYRFRKHSGYCAIRIFMHDFQIENSYNCQKDYVLLTNGYKHCGNSLFKASWTIDLRSKDYEDMRFVTDAYYSGRGLSGVYQQIACQDIADNPIIPSTTPVIPTTSSPFYCDRFITEKSFTIEVNQDYKICTFRIQKSSKDICKINVYFEKIRSILRFRVFGDRWYDVLWTFNWSSGDNKYGKGPKEYNIQKYSGK